MYSTRSSLPFGIKPVGFGAAMIVNGALMTALYLFIAPNIGAIIKDDPIIARLIEEDKPPPPEPDKRKVTTEPIRDTQVYTPPTPFTPPDPGPAIKTTPDVPYTPPVADVGKPDGTSDARPVDPPPLPPLISAQVDPRFAGAFQPEYPSSEIHLERDGKVAVRVLIGTDGRVKQVEQISATSPAFFEATRRQAMNKWRFKPASRGGTPQESWKVMNVRFEMKNL